MLDQRGTGLSTAISQSTLQLRGDEKVQAEYMKSFRADSIVADCEAIRRALTADYPEDKKKWSVMDTVKTQTTLPKGKVTKPAPPHAASSSSASTSENTGVSTTSTPSSCARTTISPSSAT